MTSLSHFSATAAPIAIVKGAGDLGSGVAYRLWRSGFRVLCTDIAQPLVIRRTVAFASAIYDTRVTVDGIHAEKITLADEAINVWRRDHIPVMPDPTGRASQVIKAEVLVDCVLAKRNIGTTINDAPIVIACGPGFEVGRDCHAIIETQRGHDLGRAIWHGTAIPDSGVPGEIGGESTQRVVRAPCDGIVFGRRAIGDIVQKGEVIANVDSTPVHATLNGVLRGLIHDDIPVKAGLKIADIDPRADARHCYSISDKALAIGGGALEAALWLMRQI